MAALSAEFVIWGIGGVAVGANHFQLGAAFPAELHTCWILELALPAFHGFPRQTVERGRPVEYLDSEETQRDGMNNDYLYPLIIRV